MCIGTQNIHWPFAGATVLNSNGSTPMARGPRGIKEHASKGSGVEATKETKRMKRAATRNTERHERSGAEWWKQPNKKKRSGREVGWGGGGKGRRGEVEAGTMQQRQWGIVKRRCVIAASRFGFSSVQSTVEPPLLCVFYRSRASLACLPS